MKSTFFHISLGTSLLMMSILSVSAVVPTGVPSGSSAPNGGYFSQYFTNLRSNPTPITPTTTCSVDSVIIGFETMDLSTLFKPRCQNFSDLLRVGLASYPGNLGIGTAASATHKLTVSGKIRATAQTDTTDTVDTIATKGYVDSQAGRILETITGETMTVNSICLNGDCRTGWPAPDTLSIAGYTEMYTNNVANEDSVGLGVNSWSTWNASPDTCNGNKTSPSSCPPSLTGTCSDKYSVTTAGSVVMGMTFFSTSYITANRVCQGVKVLYKNDANIRTANGSATIVGRDYSGSSEGCAISLNITDPSTGASCTGIRYSPKPSHYDDNLCKAWVEDAIKGQNMCPGFKGVTSSVWGLSGNTGVLTIKYLGL